MRRMLLVWISVAFVQAGSAADAAEAAAADPERAALAIAVAPFDREAPAGAAVPEVERLLADRLGTQGVRRIVGPAELAVKPDAEPTADAIRAWAEQADVSAVVVGRITRIGNQVSVDVRLRSGDTGAVIGTYVAEIASPEKLEAAVEELAAQILVAAGEPAPPEVAAAAPRDGVDMATKGDNPFGIRFSSDRPVSIRSDELEAVKTKGSRRLLFTKNVVVTQDDVTIRSNRLEAFYPPETSQPDRLVAVGGVRMTQGATEARCDEATFERAKDMLICRGQAELRDGDDCVAGEWIEFDLKADTVKVKGGARVHIAGDDSSVSGGCR